MRAGLFANPGTPVRTAVAAGLTALGYRVVYQIPGAWDRAQAEHGLDAVVVNGVRGRCGEAALYYQAEGAAVAMIDLPHLRGEGQHRVSPPSHDWLPVFEGPPPHDRLEALGVEPQTRKRVKGQSVLLVGQVSGDSAHGMDGGAYRRWVAQTLATLRSLTDSKITWRPHPKDRWQLDGADAYSDPAEESLADAMERAWVVVTYNSTGGLEALLAGLPVVAEGPAVYTPLAWRLNQFVKVTAPDREEMLDLLARISYTQWSLEEIAGGFPLEVALTDKVLPGQPEVAAPKVRPRPAPAAKASPAEPEPESDEASALTLNPDPEPPQGAPESEEPRHA